MSVEKINAHQNNLRKSQRAFIAQRIIEEFNSDPIFKKIGSYQQALSMEAIVFHFKNSPFEYEIETEVTQDELTKQKSFTQTCHFIVEVIIPATSHKIELKTSILKNILDVK